MPPKVKFQKEEIVNAALNVARQKGIEAVTAREVAAALKVSPRPIFTWFDSMEQLKAEVYGLAKGIYRNYIGEGALQAALFDQARRGVGRSDRCAALFPGNGASFPHADIQNGRCSRRQVFP